jgi:hypothetical protein
MVTEIDKRIRALCESKKITFRPWEILPWEIGDDEACCYPAGTAGAASWPQALELRAKLKAELSHQ